MSDVQWLFVVLTALYAVECLCWLRRGGVAFSTWWGRSWRRQHPGALAGNPSGGFIFASPLPPLGALFVAHQSPLSLSPEGVLAFVATNVNPGWRPAQSDRFVAWSDLREVRARGRKVLVNGEPLFLAATSGLARQLVAELKRLAALPAGGRSEAVVAFVTRTLDTKAIATRQAEWRPRAAPVRWLANVLVVYVFALAPTAIWFLGFALCWHWLLPGLLALTVTTATLFARAHRALYPAAGDERFTHALTIALAPTSAMRAHDALSRPLLETFHPLAVAWELLSLRASTAFARRLLRDLRHPALPRCPSDSPAGRRVEEFFRQTLLAAAEDFLKRQGLSLEELGRPPQPGDESVRAYCPRCEAQFTQAEGNCADCGGLALVAFAPARLEAEGSGSHARQSFGRLPS